MKSGLTVGLFALTAASWGAFGYLAGKRERAKAPSNEPVAIDSTKATMMTIDDLYTDLSYLLEEKDADPHAPVEARVRIRHKGQDITVMSQLLVAEYVDGKLVFVVKAEGDGDGS